MNPYIEQILKDRGIIIVFGKYVGLPGDFDNRVQTAQTWLAEFDVKQNASIWNSIFDIIIGEGVWQSRLRTYISRLGANEDITDTINKTKDMNDNLEELKKRTEELINSTIPQYETVTEKLTSDITADYLLIGGAAVVVLLFIFWKK